MTDQGSAPVVVLTYAYSGAFRLQQFLNQEPELACTAGTGVMAACGTAVETWQRTEGQAGEQISALARSSVRSLITGMLTVITARAGRRRWCETSTTEPSTANSFLQVFPETRLVCLHRAFPDVIYAALRSNPWGINGQQFTEFISASPANLTAALAGWWVTHTRAILLFEERHRRSCLRLRYEDLFNEPKAMERDLREFLELGPADLTDFGAPSGQRDWDVPDCGRDFPADLLPPQLVSQINTLHEELGYPELPTKKGSSVR
jgi:hypothetical protein